MGTIRNLTDRFKVASANWELIKQQALIETAPEIIPEMTEQQMRLGEMSDGGEIGSDGPRGQLKDKAYAEAKIESGGLAPPFVPDLRLHGDFQSGLRTVVTSVSLNTYSIDTKAPKLEKWYTPKIYGANPTNLSKYAIENLKPVLLEKIKNATVSG